MRGPETAQGSSKTQVSALHRPGRGNPRRAGRGTGPPRSPGALRKHLPAPAASFLGARVRKTLRKNTPMSLSGLRPTGFCFPNSRPTARGSLRAAAAVGPRGHPRRARVPSPLARPSVRPSIRPPATHVRPRPPAGPPRAARGLRRGREERPGQRPGPAPRPSRPPPARRRLPAPACPGCRRARGAAAAVAAAAARGTGATYPPSCARPRLLVSRDPAPRAARAGSRWARARAGGGARGAGRGPGLRRRLRRRRLPSARLPRTSRPSPASRARWAGGAPRQARPHPRLEAPWLRACGARRELPAGVDLRLVPEPGGRGPRGPQLCWVTGPRPPPVAARSAARRSLPAPLPDLLVRRRRSAAQAPASVWRKRRLRPPARSLARAPEPRE